jgi:predicted Rossmann fold flavoprotein
MTQTCDVAIIGGGAAGLAAAIFAAETSGGANRVLVLDGAKSLGAKILVSGGGRCNVTHDVVTPDDFNGTRPVVRNILASFPASATVAWFASMGVELKREETGKLFPVANAARAVLDALIARCKALGVAIWCGSGVTGIIPPTEDEPGFTIEYGGEARGGGAAMERQVVTSRRVIMATGGKSLPLTGSDGAGWEIVRRLGHSVTHTAAALVPLVLNSSMFYESLSGIAHEVELRALANGQLIDRRRGNLLWTHFGVSGPVVMDASRHWVLARESGAEPRMECNLLPDENSQTLEAWLIDLATTRAKASITSVLAARLPERVAKAIVSFAEIDPATMCGQLSRAARRTLVGALTALPLPVVRHRGWNYAEVTAGGVPLDEIDFRTMESRKVPGLYLVGEMLNCDGRIGGFNFQWAWSTGHQAGLAVGR